MGDGPTTQPNCLCKHHIDLADTHYTSPGQVATLLKPLELAVAYTANTMYYFTTPTLFEGV